MATNLKRFTISITPKMEKDLDSVKQKIYYKGTRNAMIRDLIIRGLASLENEEMAEGKAQGECADTSVKNLY